MACLVTVASGASYGLLAVNLLSPDLMQNVSPSRDFTDVLMGTTLVGGTLYLASSPHFVAKARVKKYFYSVYASATFTCSSVMFWLTAKQFLLPRLPNITGIYEVAGLGCSIALFLAGTTFLDFIAFHP
uniref:Uncharacterized protein n=1 Tax=Daphnia galeata TaxID=27404 RepID=A0A8J2WLS0_9CRUS|nr:unnamed protein product [Daphnia galeata]